MTSNRSNQGRIGAVAPGRGHRPVQAAERFPLMALGSIQTVCGRRAPRRRRPDWWRGPSDNMASRQETNKR